MNFVALRMLTGDRAKYLGIVLGLTFASFLITQQMAIFCGLMSRTYGAIKDFGQPDVWVMDSKVQFIDDVKPMSDTQLLRVRGVPGVKWAVPLYKGLLKARLDNGSFQTCNVFGIDDASLVGGPGTMLAGKVEDLRRAESVIVDRTGAEDKLARKKYDAAGNVIPGSVEPLTVGDTIELNDHRAIVVGICEVQRTFGSQPVVYTTYQRATQYAPRERKLLSYILAKAADGQDVGALCDRIEAATRTQNSEGLLALSGTSFQTKTMNYFMKNTGIPINFGISVLLGFLVGTAIAGQTFYSFTLDNLKHFGALKAMGATTGTLLRMILLQAVLVGVIGYGLGVGGAAIMGLASGKSELAFLMPWQLLIGTAAAIVVICVLSSLLSIQRVIYLEPAVVFKG